ncbi:hypothetical protein COCOR_00229 [Corallococcus coralloides DSM 2259]|uniref:Uncharacterized protein n=1 Tax=Corallococcus coralloides (strain ATCC 25202 / DSM 2259 / NBRC 100086 / M2) TaxID=1144275 RepID=H8MWL9_CORCM|nr:hypothetical protein [Corallococcus coralloides]AFE03356.1 hypothetical protein COCOR_00229 [Corallococcus coralloides DSM 2259]
MPLEPEAFQKTQRYQARATVAEVLEDLQALAPPPQRAPEVKPQGDGMRRLGKGLLLATGVCLGALWLLPLDSRSGFFALLLFLSFFMGLGGAMALIGSWLGAGLHSPMGWPAERFAESYKEQRRLLLATVLRRFQVDLVQDAPVEVTLDVSTPLAPGKRVHQGKHGTWDREDFSDPWLSLQGRFADGTQLHLSVVDQVRVLRRTKTLPGRVKRQSKRSGASLMTVALRVKPERHPGLTALEERARSAVKLPPGARVKRVRVAEDRVELRVLLDEGWVARGTQAVEPSEVLPGRPPSLNAPKTDASRAVTMMLLSLYQVLNHSSSQGLPGNVRSVS